jgi:hypothetical protein
VLDQVDVQIARARQYPERDGKDERRGEKPAAKALSITDAAEGGHRRGNHSRRNDASHEQPVLPWQGGLNDGAKLTDEGCPTNDRCRG